MVFFFYYIPTIGSVLAIAAPALLTLVQFDHATPFLIVLLVIGTIQVVMANVVEPAIMVIAIIPTPSTDSGCANV